MAAVGRIPGVLFVLWVSMTLGFRTPGIGDAREVDDIGGFSVTRLSGTGEIGDAGDYSHWGMGVIGDCRGMGHWGSWGH